MFQLIRHCKQSGLRGLVRRRTTFLATASSRGLSTRDSRHSKLWTPDWDNIYDEPFFGTYVTVSGGRARELAAQHEQDQCPLGGIAVKQDITVHKTALEL